MESWDEQRCTSPPHEHLRPARAPRHRPSRSSARKQSWLLRQARFARLATRDGRDRHHAPEHRGRRREILLPLCRGHQGVAPAAVPNVALEIDRTAGSEAHSVVVRGTAAMITDADEIKRVEELGLRPWLNRRSSRGDHPPASLAARSGWSRAWPRPSPVLPGSAPSGRTPFRRRRPKFAALRVDLAAAGFTVDRVTDLVGPEAMSARASVDQAVPARRALRERGSQDPALSADGVSPGLPSQPAARRRRPSHRGRRRTGASRAGGGNFRADQHRWGHRRRLRCGQRPVAERRDGPAPTPRTPPGALGRE
ncbi:pyridoxamine 5'-phosphate oxidase family protein [Kocuria rhizophila]|nr:pyridoxamine 5'-phosphate oxidase family protein [Kocuria rhizophila]